jgi:hypothetical protein
MQFTTQILSTSIAVLLVLITWRLMHLRRLREEHSLLWLLAALVLLGLSIFKGTLAAVADLLGVGYPPSLLVSVGILFLVVIELSHAVTISRLANRNRDLAQEVAILRLLLEQNQGEPMMEQTSEEKWEKEPETQREMVTERIEALA